MLRVYPNLLLLALAGALVATGCQRDMEPELLGAWQATLLVEEGDTVEVKLDEVSLKFDKSGVYNYTSTLDHEEEGTYRLEGNRLLTTPDGQDTILDRPVEIALLNDSLLYLNMLEQGRTRMLQFRRFRTSAPPIDILPTADPNTEPELPVQGEEYYDEEDLEFDGGER